MRLIAILLAFPLIVRAEAIGVAYLAAEGYSKKQCNTALKAYDGVRNPMLAILWGTFSTQNICTKQFLDKFKGKAHTLEIHFSNEAGRRNRRLGAGEFASHLDVRGLNRALERGSIRARVSGRITQIRKFLEDNANDKTRILVSTGLEDNYSRRAYSALSRQISNELKGVKIVRSPLHPTQFTPNAHFIELHGDRPKFPKGKPCIASLDGTDIRLPGTRWPLNGAIQLSGVSRFLRQNRKCARLVWWAGQQGVERWVFVKPRDRSFRISIKNVSVVNKLIREPYER